MRKGLVSLGIVVICATLLPAPVHAATQADLARDSFRLINNERRARGLKVLAWNDSLASVARRHSARMAEQQDLHHNPNLASEVRDWRRVGENVGVGGTIDQLHEALMASQSHRANILGSYEQAGTGVVVDGDGQLWLTQVFFTPMRPSSSSSVTPRPTRRATTTSTRAPARRARTTAPAAKRPTARRAAPTPTPPPATAGDVRFYRNVGAYMPFAR